MLLSNAKAVLREVLSVGDEAVAEIDDRDSLVARMDICERTDATLSLRCEVSRGKGAARVYLKTSLPIWSGEHGERTGAELNPSWLSELPLQVRSRVLSLRRIGRNQFANLLSLEDFGSQFPLGENHEIVTWTNDELRECLLIALTAAHFSRKYMPSRSKVAQLRQGARLWSCKRDS